MSEYRLYCVGESGNCYKVALMLNVCGCDWEPVFVDYFAGETRGEAVSRVAQRARRSAGARARRPQAHAERRDPHLARRPPRPLRRPRRARAPGDPALDAVRQSQVHQLLRDAALPGRHPEDRRSGGDRVPARPRARRVRRSSTSIWRSSPSCSATSRRSPTSRWSAISTTTRKLRSTATRFRTCCAWTRALRSCRDGSIPTS